MADQSLDLHDAALSQAYRELPQELPPPALDQAIRAAARQALSSPASPPRRHHRWYLPQSLAAMLVLAVGIGLMLRQMGDDALRLEAPGATRTPARAPVPAVAQPSTPVQPLTPAAEGATAAEKTVAEKTAAPPSASRATERAIAPPPAIRQKADRDDHRREQTTTQPAPPAAAPVGPEPQAFPGTAPPPPPPTQDAYRAPDKIKDAAAADNPAASMAKPSATAPVRADQPQDEHAPRRSPAAAKKLEQGAAPALPILPVADWLDKIRRLRDAGDIAAARRELGELKKQYPDQAIPPDLQALQ